MGVPGFIIAIMLFCFMLSCFNVLLEVIWLRKNWKIAEKEMVERKDIYEKLKYFLSHY